MTIKVLTMIESKDNKLRNVSLELLTAARRIAEEGEVIAVTIDKNVDSYIEELGNYGANKVYRAINEKLDSYDVESYTQALCQIIKQVEPDAILMPHTAIGKDLAPRIASIFDWGLVSDVIDVEKSENGIVFTRPIYAGKAFEKRKVTKGIPFATVRPNNINAELIGGIAEKIDFNVELQIFRTILKDVIRKTSEGIDLTEAKIVVSGGRGVKSSDGFKLLQDLADVLGAAVGASRGACDAEYCDYSLQIGQTGKVVTPDLYIACGISGAIQHLAGMSSSKVILAINKDPEAPIFEIADYGIVGDLFEVIPLLTEELKKTQYTKA